MSTTDNSARVRTEAAATLLVEAAGEGRTHFMSDLVTWTRVALERACRDFLIQSELAGEHRAKVVSRLFADSCDESVREFVGAALMELPSFVARELKYAPTHPKASGGAA